MKPEFEAANCVDLWLELIESLDSKQLDVMKDVLN